MTAEAVRSLQLIKINEKKKKRSLSKAEKTEVWTQARVSVSSVAITKYCELSDFKQQKFILFY